MALQVIFARYVFAVIHAYKVLLCLILVISFVLIADSQPVEEGCLGSFELTNDY